MAWLKGLAGKAEDLLNQIDQNAANAFQNDRKDTKIKPINWDEQKELFSDPNSMINKSPLKNVSEKKNENLEYKITLNDDLSNKSPKTPKKEKRKDNDEHLIEFLNSPSKQLPLKNENEISSESEILSSSIHIESNTQENELKTNSIEIFQIQLQDIQKELSILQQQNRELKQENLALQVKQAQLLDNDTSRTQLQIQLKSSEERTKEIELECAELRHTYEEANSRIRDLISREKRARDEVVEAREELSNYRLKAQRILQDKEKLILRLQENSSTEIQTNVTSNSSIEQDTWRRERELLVDEAQQMAHQLQIAREVAQQAEFTVAEVREQASRAQRLASERLADETRRRTVAEDEARSLLSELRALREQLIRERTAAETRAQEYEAEITRVRTQRWHKDSELEARLDALTHTLMQKHVALETATTERNALRLAQEKQREAAAIYEQSSLRGNDTDDAKALVPSFLAESPFDTSMTRRVKRAYSTLDAASVRTGVFLRRYPLARILVLCYMVLMHLWAFLLLMSSTPEARCPSSR